MTGLDNLFWARRIVDDHRRGPDVTTFQVVDLSETAGFAAIAMLALGTPEPILDDLVRRTVQAAAASGYSLGQGSSGGHIRELGRRGVLIATDNRIRFFHQTFFEFAAARGLAARGADTELPRPIARITAAPDDLFLGAVIERTLIILGSDPLARPTVAASCRALINAGHPGLVSIAITVWAHHTTIVDLNRGGLISVGEYQLRRFLRTIPRGCTVTPSPSPHCSPSSTPGCRGPSRRSSPAPARSGHRRSGHAGCPIPTTEHRCSDARYARAPTPKIYRRWRW